MAKRTRKYRRFYHTVRNKRTGEEGVEEFFDNTFGYCIPVDKFHQLRADGVSEDDIWLDHARKLLPILHGKKKHIHNLNEYIDFLFTILPSDIVEDIKEHYKDCKTLDEITKLFPEIYRPLIRLRYEYDINGDKRFNIKALQKPVAEQMSLTDKKNYNPNAFIEPE